MNHLLADNTYTFRCRPSMIGMHVSFMGFGVFAAFFIWVAMTESRGVILNGIIPISPEAVKLICWTLSCLVLLPTIFLGRCLIMFHRSPPITVSSAAIEIHLGLPPARLRIPFSKIVAVSRERQDGEEYLLIRTTRMPLRIAIKWLDSEASSRQLETLICSRLAGGPDAMAPGDKVLH